MRRDQEVTNGGNVALFWIGLIVMIVAVLIALGSLTLEEKKFGLVSAFVVALVGLALWGLGSFYSQDAGEAKVIKSISGEVNDEPSLGDGYHGKVAWSSVSTWDIRDNTMSFAGEAGADVDYNGGSVTGPRITVQDANDVDAHVDMTLRYSITGEEVVDLYKRFGSQEDLAIKVIEPDIRAAVRTAASPFTTTDIVSKRPDMQASIRKGLEAKWEPLGIVVEDVNIQEITQPDTIKAANADRAAAAVLVDRERELKEQARIEAEKNALKTKELSPEILQQQYIEAIAKSGFVVITENGSTPILNLPQKK